MDDTPNVIAVIPAYNEAGHVGRVVRSIRDLVDTVIVVDDGSRDHTGEEARCSGAYVVRHLVNRGLGGAIATGLRTAVRLGADIIVTLDADEQHLAGDALAVIEPVRRGEADFVLGSRLCNPHGMPAARQVANRVADLCTWILFGVYVRDSQSGLRAFSRRVAERLNIRTSRMEASSEIVAEVARLGFRVVEVPITARYTEYSLSKGQNFWVGVQTLAKLFLRRYV